MKLDLYTLFRMLQPGVLVKIVSNFSSKCLFVGNNGF